MPVVRVFRTDMMSCFAAGSYDRSRTLSPRSKSRWDQLTELIWLSPQCGGAEELAANAAKFDLPYNYHPLVFSLSYIQ